ncbi:helix-turn-helix domain-containing protein, partial [Lactobacillus helveticus]
MKIYSIIENAFIKKKVENKLRLYPNKTQQNQLEQMFGNDRFV